MFSSLVIQRNVLLYSLFIFQINIQNYNNIEHSSCHCFVSKASPLFQIYVLHCDSKTELKSRTNEDSFIKYPTLC